MREKIRQRLAPQACPGCGAARMYLHSFRTAWDVLKREMTTSGTAESKLGRRWHGKMAVDLSPG